MDIKQFFKDAFGHAYGKKVEDVDLPDTIPFTYPSHGNAPQPGTRRQRREAGVVVDLVTDEDFPTEDLLRARAHRRAQAQARATRQRKGNRAFQRQQMARARKDDTTRGQLRVLEGGRDKNPAMYENVSQALKVKFADELRAQGAI